MNNGHSRTGDKNFNFFFLLYVELFNKFESILKFFLFMLEYFRKGGKKYMFKNFEKNAGGDIFDVETLINNFFLKTNLRPLKIAPRPPIKTRDWCDVIASNKESSVIRKFLLTLI